MQYLFQLNTISSVGILLVVGGVVVMVITLIYIKIKKKPLNSKSAPDTKKDDSIVNLSATIDKEEGPNGPIIRFTQIAFRKSDKILFAGKGSTEINMSIGFLHEEGLNYICFETIKAEAPLNKGSNIMFHSSDDDILCMELEENPYEFGIRDESGVRIESKVHLSLAEINYFLKEEIKHISYLDSNGKTNKVFGNGYVNKETKVNSCNIFKAAFHAFFTYVRKEVGKITYKDVNAITVEPIKKRSRHISQEVKDKVWNRDGGKCVECSSNINLEFDHIIPWSKGGANTYRNIQLLCEKCNRKKSDSIGTEYEIEDELEDPFLNVLGVEYFIGK